MAGQGEAQRQVYGVADADADGDERFAKGAAVVADLKRRAGAGEVEAVVGSAGEAEGPAQAAGAGGEHARLHVCSEAAIGCHGIEAGDGFERAQQDAAGLTFDFATDIGAEVLAIDAVDIRMARRAEQDLVARRGAAIGVGGGVRSGVVRSEVGLDLHDAAGEGAGGSAVHQQLVEEPRGHLLGRILEEDAGKQAAKFFCCPKFRGCRQHAGSSVKVPGHVR